MWIRIFLYFLRLDDRTRHGEATVEAGSKRDWARSRVDDANPADATYMRGGFDVLNDRRVRCISVVFFAATLVSTPVSSVLAAGTEEAPASANEEIAKP